LGAQRNDGAGVIQVLDSILRLGDDIAVSAQAVTDMDVAQWLNGIGLGQYEALFREHEIDADVLPDLTEADFEKIGVPLGHRKRLMRAIAGLAPSPAASQGPPAAPILPRAAGEGDRPKGGGGGEERAPEEERAPSTMLRMVPLPRFTGEERADFAERRPITVMFCDLVGSTSLAARLDAEDWRNLVGAYLDEASAAVTGLGGHVLKKLGDGLMALFGYPRAQENDAERAVRAALAIQRALADLNARNARSGAPELSARIGLECGSVVVDAAGEVFGEAPNVAARVQAAAEPATVLITANVQRQTAGLFVVEDKGAHELKGVAQPVTLYRIVRASGGGRRGGARALTPLVGREDELALLTGRWSRALEGEGQFVQIVGEPGIGKSRLVEEFRAKLTETRHTWVEWAASQLLQNTPLHPLAEWGRLRFGGADATDEGRFADLENTLSLIGLDAAECAPLLAPLVDIPLREDRRAKFAPEELRRRQLAAMTAWVLAGARSQPAVIAFEDLHWADPTSLDLLRALAERGAQSPLLVVATTRPEFRAPWAVRSHHSVVSLAPLDRAQVRRMVGEIASRHALSDEMIDGVGERTGGVPLFVEEVTRLLLERDAQGGAQAIPPTLQQSLAARLDRLGEAREIAQIGAVLGRDFSYALLRAVAAPVAAVADRGPPGHAGLTERGYSGPALQAALDRLTEADLLFVDGAPPTAVYRFKHALIQDAAYESLLRSRRQALHRRAAEALRDANAEPEAIAHHFTEAGLDDLAIEWWGKAGDQALRRSAFQEAIAHLGKAIEMADRAGETSRRAPGHIAAVSQRLPQLHAAYGNALIAARGHGAPETMEAFARARKSASGDEDAPGRFAADYGLWVGSFVRGDLPSMRTHAAAFLAGVEARPDSPEAGVAHRVLGTTHWFAGEYAEAREHLERALTLFQPGRDDDLAFRFGQDAAVAAMCYLAIASWPLGNVKRAVSLVDGAHERLASVAHIGTHPYAKLHAAMFELMRGHRARAARNGSETARLAREHDLPLWRAYGSFFEGLATAELGALGEGLSDMRRSAESLRQQNLLNFDGLFKIALAETEARAGDRDRAIATIDEALATANRLGYRAFEAELNRARGEILLQRDPASPAPAEEAFQTAIAVAKQQGTRSFELRAALALAKLYQSTRRPADAHAVLAPALEDFAPTPEMPEIAEAEALLAALAQTDEAKAEAAQQQRLTRLQVAYGNALIAARGFGAPETTEAFARARESAFGDKDASERLAADYGLWVGCLVRGELSPMRAYAETFLGDVAARPDSPEAGVAHRVAGINLWFTGEYAEAKSHLERALALFQPGRDDDLAFRFGHDAGVGAMQILAFVSWALGDVDRAVSLINRMVERVATIHHVGSLALGRMYAAIFAVMRNDLPAGKSLATEFVQLARAHDLPLFRAFALFLDGWAKSNDSAVGGGLAEMRQGVESLRNLNIVFFDGLIKVALAEAEARAGDPERARAIIDEALATCDRAGYRAFEAELRRARGEMLLMRDLANQARAEEAFKTAIAVAKQQSTRSFELRAALALAKLYQSTDRLADAHAVLAPALEGFAPTPEMPEIEEAQALLAALAESEEVKADAARWRRTTQLQADYGAALISARGYGAPETTEAFSRARESAPGDTNAPERLVADYGLWAGSYARGELPWMRMHAAAFVRDVEARPDSPGAGIAHRVQAKTHYFAGEFVEAVRELERALALFEPGRDDDLAVRFPPDPGVASMIYLAFASWALGEAGRAVSFVERMGARMAEFSHAPTLAFGRVLEAFFSLMRGDRPRARTSVSELALIVRDHDLPVFRAFGEFLVGWATIDGGALADGLEAMRRGAESLRRQNVVVYDGLVKIALAEAEARAGDPERALKILEEALATCDRMGYRAYECELHRARGELLHERDPANPVLAEEAFRTAIAIAKRQGARGYKLLASLALAKLYQSAGRPVEAHAVLGPALEGFSPTPEMPEIAEGQVLLAALEEMEKMKAEAAQRERRAQLQVGLANALMHARGFHAPETRAALDRASEYVSRVDDPMDRLATYYGHWVGSLTRGEAEQCVEISNLLIQEAAKTADVQFALIARRVRGVSRWMVGDLARAQEDLEWVVAHYNFDRDRDLALRFGQDQGALAKTFLAFAVWLRGQADRARALIDEGLKLAERAAHPPTVAAAQYVACSIECARLDLARAKARAERTFALGCERDMALWRLVGESALRWAIAAKEETRAAWDDLDRALAGVEAQSVTNLPEGLRPYLAAGYAKIGETELALAVAEKAVRLAQETGLRAFLPEAHRVRGEILFKRNPGNPEPAEQSLLTAIAIAGEQGSRSFGLRAALSLAELYQSTGRPVEAHAVLASALEGFSPTPEMPEIAEAAALLAALAEMDEVKAHPAQLRRLTHLQVAYGNALIAARGFGAPETTQAFARARESASGEKDAPERLAADYGLWVGSFTRGELPSMRAHAAAFLGDVEARPDSPEAGVAHRAAGMTCWFAGEYRDARDHLECALALFQPGRDDDLAFRFGQDPGVSAMPYLAIASWALGEVDRSVLLIDRMQTRMAGIAHVGTLAVGRLHAALFELMRGDRTRAAPNAFELARLAREHELNQWRAFGVFLEGWATAASGAIGNGLEDMRRGVDLLREQNILVFDGLLKIALAEVEARAGDPARAVAILDEALATCDRTGYRAFEAELHRARGEMLLRRDPGNPGPAAEALLIAIAVAKQQGTRSFELRSALSLAKLYQSTGRPAEAHAVLAPALEGFAPTPEMPEIAEAQALLATLAETDEVRAEVTRRQRLTQLHVAYGNALFAVRGTGAPETTAAFARARESAYGEKDALERLAADYGLWASSYVRGELPSMRTRAATFLRDVEARPDSPEAGVAHRVLGTTHWFAGEYVEARDHLEHALALFQPGRDDDLAFCFGLDAGVAAMLYLAFTLWALGDIERAVSLLGRAQVRIAGLTHVQTRIFGRNHAALFELMRGDVSQAVLNAAELARLASDNDLNYFRPNGVFIEGWVKALSGAPADGLEDMRRGVELLREQNILVFDGLLKIALAEVEARAGDPDRAIAIVDEALATADRTGYRAFEAELRRARGDILLKSDPENPARAEQAYLAAISVAREQGARSFGLRAALSLAKLYRSTGRPVEAHAVLAPALEGFAPTPEMPEIAEAQALLAAVEETEEVKADAARRQRLTRLHIAYGNAAIAARGYGAPETTDAFRRARESASGDKDSPGRLEADYGLWASSYVRGELPSMRTHAAAFLRDVEETPDSPEAGVAHRAAGITCWFAGEYAQARDHFERALALFQPGRDDDLAFRFGHDAGVGAMFNLAVASWPLGEVDRAISLIERMQTRIAGLEHVTTIAFGRLNLALFELMRRDPARVLQNASELSRLAGEHDLPMWGAAALFLQGWATATNGAPGDGLEDMRRGVELLREQNVVAYDGLLKIALAEAEARAGDPDRAVAILDEALATCDRLGHRAFEAELHRARGEILLKRDPASLAPAEEAFLTAIAVAKQQGTRSFELRAALSLAKLYQSTGRPADAHAVLAPALEGFAPTPAMPEIAEAQALLAALGRETPLPSGEGQG
jgi:predicted ATPase/class 3 adenylate cyclase